MARIGGCHEGLLVSIALSDRGDSAYRQREAKDNSRMEGINQ